MRRYHRSHAIAEGRPALPTKATILGTDQDAGVTRQRIASCAAETGDSPLIRASDAHAEFRARRFFGSLNGLRALSVLAVIWHHAGPPYNDAMPYLLANGAHGVTLFFAISGFLIVTLLLRERERTGQIDLKAFYIRRSLRIFPLYYAVITLYVVPCRASKPSAIGPTSTAFAPLRCLLRLGTVFTVASRILLTSAGVGATWVLVLVGMLAGTFLPIATELGLRRVPAIGRWVLVSRSQS